MDFPLSVRPPLERRAVRAFEPTSCPSRVAMFQRRRALLQQRQQRLRRQ
jgi:hypothetical protein